MTILPLIVCAMFPRTIALPPIKLLLCHSRSASRHYVCPSLTADKTQDITEDFVPRWEICVSLGHIFPISFLLCSSIISIYEVRLQLAETI